MIGERLTEGVDFGPGQGDMGESSLHALVVGLGRRFLEQTHRADPDSPVVEVATALEVEEGWLDAVGLDDSGTLVVILEAKRVNNDRQRDIPETDDKIAAQEPDEAIWIVPSQDSSTVCIDALDEPLTGEPRVA